MIAVEELDPNLKNDLSLPDELWLLKNPSVLRPFYVVSTPLLSPSPFHCFEETGSILISQFKAWRRATEGF